jgi:hypothetical protein
VISGQSKKKEPSMICDSMSRINCTVRSNSYVSGSVNMHKGKKKKGKKKKLD